MIKSKKLMVEKEFVDSVICNKCGVSIPTDNGGPEMATLYANWGYGSRKDGLMEQSELCELCYDEFVDTFIIIPTDLRG